MADTEIGWEGRSGREYTYWIHRIGTQFLPGPGSFIYATEIEPDAWLAVYVGHTDDLAEGLAGSAAEEIATRLGATHVHVHTNLAEPSRRAAEERDLIARWKPAGNGAASTEPRGSDAR